jgi:hypothetical protein
MAPRSWNLPEPGQPTEEVDAMTIAHDAHPPGEDHDDTVEAHYASLERPHACIDGWVFVTYEDEHGEEREASYRCRRCASEASR